MTVQEVANRLVELCRIGDFETALKELYSDNIKSIEVPGSPAPNIEGMEAKIEKSKHFQDSVEAFHSNEISEPLVADSFFSITMKMEVTFKGAGRVTMEEVCVYEVRDGKIVLEQFFFTPDPVPSAS